MAFNDMQEKMRIIVVRHKRENSDAGHKQTVKNSQDVGLKYNQMPSPSVSTTSASEASTVLQPHSPQAPPSQVSQPINPQFSPPI